MIDCSQLDKTKYYYMLLAIIKDESKHNDDRMTCALYDIAGDFIREVNFDEFQHLTSDNSIIVLGRENAKSYSKGTSGTVFRPDTGSRNTVLAVFENRIVTYRVDTEGPIRARISSSEYKEVDIIRYINSINDQENVLDMRGCNTDFTSYKLTIQEGVRFTGNNNCELEGVTAKCVSIPEDITKVIVAGYCNIDELILPKSCKLLIIGSFSNSDSFINIKKLHAENVQKLEMAVGCIEELYVSNRLKDIYITGIKNIHIKDIVGKLKLIRLRANTFKNINFENELDLSECDLGEKFSLHKISCDSIILPAMVRELSVDNTEGIVTCTGYLERLTVTRMDINTRGCVIEIKAGCSEQVHKAVNKIDNPLVKII